MAKYTDDDIRKASKITCKMAGEYLGISSMAVSIGMRNNLLPIGLRFIMKRGIDHIQKAGATILLGNV